MRIFITLLTVLVFFACGGEPPEPETTTEELIPPGPITLKQGQVSLTVDPDYGARIISFKYGDREVLNQDAEREGLRFGSSAGFVQLDAANDLAPAAFDREKYRVRKVRDNVYLFTSQLDPASELRLEKRVQLTERGEVGLRYEVVNESGVPVGVAAKEMTRVPYAGYVEFVTGDTLYTDARALPVEQRKEWTLIPFDEQVRTPQTVAATMRDTMVRYHNNGLVLTRQTLITARNQVTPGTVPLTVYLDPKTEYAEIALQGGYYRLEPGQRATMRTKWILKPE